MKQSDIFSQSESDRWLERNRARLGWFDPVMSIMDMINIRPRNVLEIGCANGWRLADLRDRYSCWVFGVEPGKQAAAEARARSIPAIEGTATKLPIRSNVHDVIIYGFCLYLTDPADWFQIVAEGDRVLQPGGHLIIHDFGATEFPFARVYEHCDGVNAYHVDFAKFWLANPLYELIHRTVLDEDEMVTILKKLPLETIEVAS